MQSTTAVCTRISVSPTAGLAMCIGKCVRMLMQLAVWPVAPKWLYTRLATGADNSINNLVSLFGRAMGVVVKN